jgi:hypothetical protein
VSPPLGFAVVARHWGQQIREGQRAGADRPRDLAGSDGGRRGGAGAGLEAAEGSGRREATVEGADISVPFRGERSGIRRMDHVPAGIW